MKSNYRLRFLDAIFYVNKNNDPTNSKDDSQ